jgi:hypothetical protein
MDGWCASLIFWGRGFGFKTKTGSAIRIHHLDAGQYLRFKSQKFAGVMHFGIPAGGKVLALPAVHLVEK